MNNRILRNHVTVGLMETDHLNGENWNLEIGSDNYDYHESVGFYIFTDPLLLLVHITVPFVNTETHSQFS